MDYAKKLSLQYNIKEEYVANIISLLDEGNTIPFIARYRKEMHGSLDDQLIREIADKLTYLRNLDTRREEVRELIRGQEKLTDEISDSLDKAETLAEIEDIYRPFKPKRKTRASVAKEKGLEPLALTIFAQEDAKTLPIEMAKAYVDSEKGVETEQDALQGALDIIAEMISDNADIRKRVRNIVFRNGNLVSKAVDPEKDSVYTLYYDFKEPVEKIASHRVLAVNRGEDEEVLKVSIEIEPSKCLNIMKMLLVKGNTPCGNAVITAAEDAYDRLIFPSIEREIRTALTDDADEKAIKLFSLNLHQLLMQPPVKNKVAIGLDPGYRTGCKLAVVDETGKVLDTGVAHITLGKGASLEKGKDTIRKMLRQHHVTAVAIGNGTASRESEAVVAELLKELPYSAAYMVVSEAGASVYSASKLAAEEFPEYDVSLRSAVSIARRLQDPLAELVKIDPQAIGVGQYQHDMPKAELSAALDGVVEDCVNHVGVDLNTASFSLLSHIAGINQTIAKNIVAYRTENGVFTDRKQLKKVAKLGPKAYEQCAGFLRVPGAKNPLDNTAVHPESYGAAEQILRECGFQLADIAGQDRSEITSIAKQHGIAAIAKKAGVGEPTVKDIIKELAKPGRDPRDELPPPLLRSGDIMELKDLKPGMELVGTVRNVIDFGCFVDIGVHEDGLVHISQICDRFIKHPLEAVKVGEVVKVWVLDVDLKRKRIALTMKPPKKG